MTTDEFKAIAKDYIEGNVYAIRKAARYSEDPVENELNHLLCEATANAAEQACTNVIVCMAVELLKKGVLHDE